jgi:hypothetical protein
VLEIQAMKLLFLPVIPVLFSHQLMAHRAETMREVKDRQRCLTNAIKVILICQDPLHHFKLLKNLVQNWGKLQSNYRSQGSLTLISLISNSVSEKVHILVLQNRPDIRMIPVPYPRLEKRLIWTLKKKGCRKSPRRSICFSVNIIKCFNIKK